MTTRILFVCLGNICRSPSAEGVTQAIAKQRDLAGQISLDSAGTGAWHLGEPPYGPMQVAALERGYDLSNLQARQVTQADFDRFDLILAMDADNLANLNRMRPQSTSAQVRLFTDYISETGVDHVPDPYYTRDFNGVLDLIERCAKGLLDQL